MLGKKKINRQHLKTFVLFSTGKRVSHFMQNVSICIKCQILFSEKIAKIASICALLNLPQMLHMLNIDITKTRLFKYIENFTSKNRNFSVKKTPDIFHISAQNINCGYLLEPPRRGGSNEYPQSMFLSRNKKNNVYP